jgi:hypothetical protein
MKINPKCSRPVTGFEEGNHYSALLKEKWEEQEPLTRTETRANHQSIQDGGRIESGMKCGGMFGLRNEFEREAKAQR